MCESDILSPTIYQFNLMLFIYLLVYCPFTLRFASSCLTSLSIFFHLISPFLQFLFFTFCPQLCSSLPCSFQTTINTISIHHFSLPTPSHWQLYKNKNHPAGHTISGYWGQSKLSIIFIPFALHLSDPFEVTNSILLII